MYSNFHSKIKKTKTTFIPLFSDSHCILSQHVGRNLFLPKKCNYRFCEKSWTYYKNKFGRFSSFHSYWGISKKLEIEIVFGHFYFKQPFFAVSEADQISRFDVYWTLTNKNTNWQTNQIYTYIWYIEYRCNVWNKTLLAWKQ